MFSTDACIRKPFFYLNPPPKKNLYIIDHRSEYFKQFEGFSSKIASTFSIVPKALQYMKGHWCNLLHISLH